MVVFYSLIGLVNSDVFVWFVFRLGVGGSFVISIKGESFFDFLREVGVSYIVCFLELVIFFSCVEYVFFFFRGRIALSVLLVI